MIYQAQDLKYETYVMEQKNKGGNFLFYTWERYSYFAGQSLDEYTIALFICKKLKTNNKTK